MVIPFLQVGCGKTMRGPRCTGMDWNVTCVAPTIGTKLVAGGGVGIVERDDKAVASCVWKSLDDALRFENLNIVGVLGRVSGGRFAHSFLQNNRSAEERLCRVQREK